jgi:hypothetical protein
MEKILDNYEIIYSNYFKIGDKLFAFRNKYLFDITSTPKYLELKENGGSYGYWINRNWYSLTKIKSMIIKKPIQVDVSNLQWHKQIELDLTFNL